jgi:hypothetical protein
MKYPMKGGTIFFHVQPFKKNHCTMLSDFCIQDRHKIKRKSPKISIFCDPHVKRGSQNEFGFIKLPNRANAAINRPVTSPSPFT